MIASLNYVKNKNMAETSTIEQVSEKNNVQDLEQQLKNNEKQGRDLMDKYGIVINSLVKQLKRIEKDIDPVIVNEVDAFINDSKNLLTSLEQIAQLKTNNRPDVFNDFKDNLSNLNAKLLSILVANPSDDTQAILSDLLPLAKSVNENIAKVGNFAETISEANQQEQAKKQAEQDEQQTMQDKQKKQDKFTQNYNKATKKHGDILQQIDSFVANPQNIPKDFNNLSREFEQNKKALEYIYAEGSDAQRDIIKEKLKVADTKLRELHDAFYKKAEETIKVEINGFQGEIKTIKEAIGNATSEDDKNKAVTKLKKVWDKHLRTASEYLKVLKFQTHQTGLLELITTLNRQAGEATSIAKQDLQILQSLADQNADSVDLAAGIIKQTELSAFSFAQEKSSEIKGNDNISSILVEFSKLPIRTVGAWKVLCNNLQKSIEENNNLYSELENFLSRLPDMNLTKEDEDILKNIENGVAQELYKRIKRSREYVPTQETVDGLEIEVADVNKLVEGFSSFDVDSIQKLNKLLSEIKESKTELNEEIKTALALAVPKLLEFMQNSKNRMVRLETNWTIGSLGDILGDHMIEVNINREVISETELEEKLEVEKSKGKNADDELVAKMEDELKKVRQKHKNYPRKDSSVAGEYVVHHQSGEETMGGAIDLIREQALAQYMDNPESSLVERVGLVRSLSKMGGKQTLEVMLDEVQVMRVQRDSLQAELEESYGDEERSDYDNLTIKRAVDKDFALLGTIEALIEPTLARTVVDANQGEFIKEKREVAKITAETTSPERMEELLIKWEAGDNIDEAIKKIGKDFPAFLLDVIDHSFETGNTPMYERALQAAITLDAQGKTEVIPLLAVSLDDGFKADVLKEILNNSNYDSLVAKFLTEPEYKKHFIETFKDLKLENTDQLNIAYEKALGTNKGNEEAVIDLIISSWEANPDKLTAESFEKLLNNENPTARVRVERLLVNMDNSRILNLVIDSLLDKFIKPENNIDELLIAVCVENKVAGSALMNKITEKITDDNSEKIQKLLANINTPLVYQQVATMLDGANDKFAEDFLFEYGTKEGLVSIIPNSLEVAYDEHKSQDDFYAKANQLLNILEEKEPAEQLSVFGDLITMIRNSKGEQANRLSEFINGAEPFSNEKIKDTVELLTKNPAYLKLLEGDVDFNSEIFTELLDIVKIKTGVDKPLANKDSLKTNDFFAAIFLLELIGGKEVTAQAIRNRLEQTKDEQERAKLKQMAMNSGVFDVVQFACGEPGLKVQAAYIAHYEDMVDFRDTNSGNFNNEIAQAIEVDLLPVYQKTIEDTILPIIEQNQDNKTIAGFAKIFKESLEEIRKLGNKYTGFSELKRNIKEFMLQLENLDLGDIKVGGKVIIEIGDSKYKNKTYKVSQIKLSQSINEALTTKLLGVDVKVKMLILEGIDQPVPYFGNNIKAYIGEDVEFDDEKVADSVEKPKKVIDIPKRPESKLEILDGLLLELSKDADKLNKQYEGLKSKSKDEDKIREYEQIKRGKFKGLIENFRQNLVKSLDIEKLGSGGVFNAAGINLQIELGKVNTTVEINELLNVFGNELIKVIVEKYDGDVEKVVLEEEIEINDKLEMTEVLVRKLVLKLVRGEQALLNQLSSMGDKGNGDQLIKNWEKQREDLLSEAGKQIEFITQLSGDDLDSELGELKQQIFEQVENNSNKNKIPPSINDIAVNVNKTLRYDIMRDEANKDNNEVKKVIEVQAKLKKSLIDIGTIIRKNGYSVQQAMANPEIVTNIVESSRQLANEFGLDIKLIKPILEQFAKDIATNPATEQANLSAHRAKINLKTLLFEADLNIKKSKFVKAIKAESPEKNSKPESLPDWEQLKSTWNEARNQVAAYNLIRKAKPEQIATTLGIETSQVEAFQETLKEQRSKVNNEGESGAQAVVAQFIKSLEVSAGIIKETEAETEVEAGVEEATKTDST